MHILDSTYLILKNNSIEWVTQSMSKLYPLIHKFFSEMGIWLWAYFGVKNSENIEILIACHTFPRNFCLLVFHSNIIFVFFFLRNFLVSEFRYLVSFEVIFISVIHIHISFGSFGVGALHYRIQMSFAICCILSKGYIQCTRTHQCHTCAQAHRFEIFFSPRRFSNMRTFFCSPQFWKVRNRRM